MRTFLTVGSLVLLTATSILAGWKHMAPAANSPESVTDIPPSDFGIGALGRIEPKSEVLHINAPSVMEPPLVAELLVKVGDHVTAGQVLARLDSHRREMADVASARAALNLAEKNLARVLAGAKTGEIVAQEALVERTRSRLMLAQKQLDRAEKLTTSRALSAEDLDVARTELETEQRELHQHEATLLALKEIRPVDIDYAQAQIDRARADLERAEADLEVALIRSPIDGVVLEINTRVGERVGEDGLLALGDTSEMDVVAEVHETDIIRVRPGQRAEIKLRNWGETLHGHVIEIGRLVGRMDVLSNDPVDDTDARVVEVRIRLDKSCGELVAGMSYARVEVMLQAASPAGEAFPNESSGAAGLLRE
ncbi:MAG: efflux RND transporter periplasmic adaptor subunit [Planctomycetaceae bacterium]|nr:efflux RND transporter periplasmic adaptor subunit [Planctomycetaceae bacterium]